MVFLCYHRFDMEIAFRICDLLLRAYRQPWLDVYEIAPQDDWAAETAAARGRAELALLVLSRNAVACPRCRAEIAAFREAGIAIIAVLTQDIPSQALEPFPFHTLLDIRGWVVDRAHPSVEALLQAIAPADDVKQRSEKQAAALQLIQDIELALAAMPTAWIAHHAAASRDFAAEIPAANWLQRWDFEHLQAEGAEPLADFEGWAQQEPRFLLQGASGSGKTVSAQLIARQAAHAVLLDENARLPIWVDMALWQGGEQTFADFIESQWVLVSYWQHWLQQHDALFIVDNWSAFAAQHPQAALEFQQWMEAQLQQHFILLVDGDAPSPPHWGRVRIAPVAVSRLLGLVADGVSPPQQAQIYELLCDSETSLSDAPLALTLLHMELMAAGKPQDWWQQPVPALIEARATLHASLPAERIRADLPAPLRALAWWILTESDSSWVQREVAQAHLGSAELLQYALWLGILRLKGGRVQFESQALHWLLALDKLRPATMRHVVAHPAYAPESYERIPQRGDGLLLLLVARLPAEERLGAIDQIAAVDPLLAAHCLRRYPQHAAAYQARYIKQLLRHCAQEPAARAHFQSALACLPDTVGIAESLLAQMPRYANPLKAWIWQEIAALPLSPPADFIALLHTSNTSRPPSASTQLSAYPLAHALAYLCALTRQDDSALRHAALHSFSELKVLPSALFLFGNLDSVKGSDLRATLQALLNFGHADILVRILQWALAKPAQSYALVPALAARGRHLSSALLELAHARRMSLEPEFAHVAVRLEESELALGVAQLAANRAIAMTPTLAAALDECEQAARFCEQAAAAIRHLPNREGFTQLLAAAERSLEAPPPPLVRAGSHLEALLFGKNIWADVADSGTKQAQHPARADSTPVQPSDAQKIAHALSVLRGEDWRAAQKAASFMRRLARSQGSQDNPELLPALLPALDAPEWTVRWGVIGALAALDSDELRQRLPELLRDPSWQVQLAAAQATAELQVQVLAKQLHSMLSCEQLALQVVLARSLAALQYSAARESLLALWRGQGPAPPRVAALQALCRLFPDEAQGWLYEALREPGWELRSCALRQLLPLMTAKDLPLLQGLLTESAGEDGVAADLQEMARQAIQGLQALPQDEKLATRQN